MGILNIVPGVKYHFVECLATYNVCYKPKAFYILLIYLNDTLNGILFSFKTVFELNRY